MNERFGSPYATYTSLGRISSLLGMVLFSVSLILSGRFYFLEDFFGSMSQIYIVHHQVGGSAFLLLMVHPLLLSITKAMISWDKAVMFFLPSSDWAINFGIFSLALLMLLLVLTYFIKLKYQIWNFTHKFLGLALFFGVIHIFLIESDISRSDTLRYYYFFLMVVALAVYLYRTVFGFLFIKTHRFKVNSVVNLNADVWQIKMTSQSGKFNFLPGQYIFVSFHSPGISSEAHPFSISSSPQDDELSLDIKSLGDFTKKLGFVQLGSIARIEGPYGRFFQSESSQEVWIAGGIGITPFISKVKALKNFNARIDLFYIVHDVKEAVALDEILAVARQNPLLRVCLYNSSVEGKRISAEIIDSLSFPIQKKDIFICGPPAMMHSLTEQFKKLKVPPNQIHFEEFQFL